MRQAVNRILAVILILTIFTIGSVTMVSRARELGYAALVSYTLYLKPEGSWYNGINARIQSLNNAININLFGKEFFQKFNANMQLLMGKQTINYGPQTMVKLTTGQLYDIQSDVDVSSDIKKMADLSAVLKEKNIPMLYVYMHSELYEDGMLPEGVKDYNNKVADDIVNQLRGAGIRTIDSRDVKDDYSLTLDECVYRTDNHCAMPLNFAVYSQIIKDLNEMADFDLDESKGDIANYDIETIVGAHRASVGQRLPELVEPDDFALITPKYDTFIRRSISSSDGFVDTEGTFRDAVLNLDILDELKAEPTANLYDIYGHHTEAVYFENDDAPDHRVLVIKDSFGTPTATLLSLSVRNELAIDLRKTQRSAESYIDEYQPEAVIIIHCQEMMRGNNYVFIG